MIATRLLACALTLATTEVLPAQQTAAPPGVPFTFQEVMIPVRDGAHLQTVILTPTGRKGPLPVLFRRTPYGVPSAAPTQIPASFKELTADGYIFVFQNLRGRFKSEGSFRIFLPPRDLSNPKSTDETTDAYDSIDWLVKNIPNNNGKVGMYGVSYDGLTTALALLDPHPALKAISEQASPTDQWMNDDEHRYGALRQSYAFEYAVLEEADKNKNTHFEFDTFDTYSWYLQLGPLSSINANFLHGTIPRWNDIVAHPDYDSFWRRSAWTGRLHASTVPNLNVAGFYDQEDPWGPWQIFRHAAEHDPEHTNFMVAGPWYHGGWQAPKGDSIGLVALGSETSREFRENIQAPFFRYYLHGIGAKPAWRVTTYQLGSNKWRSYNEWPPSNVKPTDLYLGCDGTLSWQSPPSGDRARYREYISDPANPVPYRQRPISPTYPGGDWRTWEVADQRFVDNRPDVLTYITAPLDRDITITGPVAAHLFASTSGTDADFVVKLIDVYPESFEKPKWNPDNGPEAGAFARTMNGYELPVAMEVRRGRYLKSYEHPSALLPNVPVDWDIPLRDRDHVFLKGHRLMVQVQSTWFPIIDRNPQKFVPSIYEAKASDYVKATQRVYCGSSPASRIVLPVVQ